jgi:hypothetical protein
MTILIVFCILNIITFGYIWFLWDKISTGVEIADVVAEGVSKESVKVAGAVLVVRNAVSKCKKFLWFPAGILVFLNFVCSLVIGGIVLLIMAMF